MNPTNPSSVDATPEQVVTLADLVVQLSAIRTVLREAHFALDDSEDLSHLDEPVHAVPLDNVMRLHRALKTCERFAPKDEIWESPGPLVTQIIEHLGHHLTALTASANPNGVAENKAGGLWYRRWFKAQARVNELERAPVITDEQVKLMVNRFLQWKLPANFNPDGGISFDAVVNLGTEHQRRREPVGTNLLDAKQAEAMVRHILEGMSL